MFKLLLKFVINAAAVLVAANFISGVQVNGYVDALVVAVVLSLLNTIVKPILKFLAFPITIMTLGLFLLVINAVMVMATDYFVSGFEVGGFIPALLFSIVLSVVTYIAELIFGID